MRSDYDRYLSVSCAHLEHDDDDEAQNKRERR